MPPASPSNQPGDRPHIWWRRPLRWGITLALLALVVWFAGGTLQKAWEQLSTTTFDISLAWLLLSGLLYVVGLFPMACFWRLVLARLGQYPGWRPLLRAYYLGHLGKYVPGKAMVVLLRTGTLVAAGTQPRATVVSVFLETLTFMATGAAMAALLIATHANASPLLVMLSAALASLAGLPICPPIARRLARRVAPRSAGESDDPTMGITWSLTGWGVLAATISWGILGLSLWAIVRSLGLTGAHPFWQLPLWIESVSLPVVAGFLSLLPGGLGVRDTLLVELLSPELSKLASPEIAAAAALVAAALWRLISVVSEVAACGMIECSRLYRSPSPPRSDTP